MLESRHKKRLALLATPKILLLIVGKRERGTSTFMNETAGCREITSNRSHYQQQSSSSNNFNSSSEAPLALNINEAQASAKQLGEPSSNQVSNQQQRLLTVDSTTASSEHQHFSNAKQQQQVVAQFQQFVDGEQNTKEKQKELQRQIDTTDW